MKKLKISPILLVIFILIINYSCQNKNEPATYESIKEIISSSKTSKDFIFSDSLLSIAYQESSTIRDTGLMALSRIVQGNLYLKNRKFDSSYVFLTEALGLLKESANDTLKISCYGIIGNYHLQKSRSLEREYHLNTALENYQSSLFIGLKLDDSTRIGTTEINLGIIFKELNIIDSSLIHFQKANSYLKNSTNLTLKATAALNLAQLQLSIGNLKDALEYNKKALSIYENISGDEINQCQAYLHLGDIFRVGEQLDSAAYYFELALDSAEWIGPPLVKDFIKMRSNDNLGAVLKSLGKFTSAKEKLDTALVLAESMENAYMVGNIHINIGNLFLEQDSFSLAKSSFEESFNIFTQINYPQGIATSLGSIGKYYSRISKPDSAIYYYNESKKLHEATTDKLNLSIDYLNLGITTFQKNKQENTNEAIQYFDEGLALIDQIGSSKNKDKFLFSLAEVYGYKGNYQKANQYLLEFITLKDSLNDSEVPKKVALIEGQFNNERYARIEKEDKLRIQKLEINDLKKSKQISRNRTVSFFLGIIIVIGFLAFRRIRKDQLTIKRTNKNLQLSNKQKDGLLHVLRHQVKNDFNRFGGQLDTLSFTQSVGKEYQTSITNLRNKAIAQGKLYSILYGERADYETIYLQPFIKKWIKEIISINNNTDFDDNLVEMDFKATPKMVLKYGEKLALIIYEIIVNSFKHAFKDGRKPKFSIGLFESADNKITFKIKDNGVGFPEEIPTTASSKISGLGLIKMLTNEDLEGEIKMYNENGAVYEITSPKFNLESINK
ncbi:MAG: hypothetical protein DWQ02_21120 [Bacteroidetes bacterium]|nr:MAG: hypothetical protein DWQ02_21120 [Bacteroidota bacterium]